MNFPITINGGIHFHNNIMLITVHPPLSIQWEMGVNKTFRVFCLTVWEYKREVMYIYFSELDDNGAGASNKRRVNNLLKKVPDKGDFQLDSVLDSVYFFS